MTEFMVQFGSQQWLERLAPVIEDGVTQITSCPNSPEPGRVKLILRENAESDQGGAYCGEDVALVYVGQCAANESILRPHGFPTRDGIGAALAKLWRRFGDSLFAQLDGVLACALWDYRSASLHCFRDKIGLVPLVFHQESAGQGVIASTDADWIAKILPDKPEPNLRRLAAFLLQHNDSGTDDFLIGFSRIRPSEHVTWTWRSSLAVSRATYWRPLTEHLPSQLNLANLLEHRLQEVMAALGDQKPIVEMSSGLDSTALAALEIERRQLSRDRPLDVISMVAPGFPKTDEGPHLFQVQNQIPIRVHPFPIGPHGPLSAGDIYQKRLATGPHFHPEESYAIPFLRWGKEKAGENRIISGVGADQAFYCPKIVFVRDVIAHNDLGRLLKQLPLHQLAREVIFSTAKKHLRYLGVGDVVQRWRSVFVKKCGRTRSDSPWLRPEGWVQHYLGPPVLTPFVSDDGSTWGEAHLEQFSSWSWEFVCRSGYRKSREAGVTRIYPMLSPRLWSLTLRIPPRTLRSLNTTKVLLREVMRERLGTELVNAPKRGLFDSFIQHALAQQVDDAIRFLFHQSRLQAVGLIDERGFLSVFEQYRQAVLDSKHQYLGSFPLWSTIAAELWLRSLTD